MITGFFACYSHWLYVYETIKLMLPAVRVKANIGPFFDSVC